MNGESSLGIKKLAVGCGAVVLLAASFVTASAMATGQTASEGGDTLTVDFDAPGVNDSFVDVFCGDVSTLQGGQPFPDDYPRNEVRETGEQIGFTIDDVVFRARCDVRYPSADVATCVVGVEGLGTVEVAGEQRELFELVEPGRLFVTFPDDFVLRDGVVTITCEPVDTVVDPGEPGGEDPVDPEPVRAIECSLTGGPIISFVEDSLGFDPFIGEENFPTRLNALGDTPGLAGVLEFEMAIHLPAGEYSLFGESADTHSGRAFADNPIQPSEQWFAEFLAADGSILATSGTTEDVPDLVRFGEWAGSIGDITLSEDAVSIRVLHATPGTPTQNSHQPVCLSAVGEAVTEVVVGGVEIVEELPSEPIEVIEDVPELVEEQPEPEKMSAEIVVEPAVLGVVDIAPVAQSQAANPAFTG